MEWRQLPYGTRFLYFSTITVVPSLSALFVPMWTSMVPPFLPMIILSFVSMLILCSQVRDNPTFYIIFCLERVRAHCLHVLFRLENRTSRFPGTMLSANTCSTLDEQFASTPRPMAKAHYRPVVRHNATLSERKYSI